MAHRSEERAAGYVYVLIAAGLWALITPGMRYLLEAGVRPFEIAVWRSAMAWVLFGGMLVVRGVPLRVAREHWAAVVALGLTGVAGLYVTLPLAVEAGGAALASILLYTAPAWVALLSWPVLRERLTRRKAAALALTLGGIAAFAGGGVEGAAGGTAIGWGLLAGLCYAGLYLLGKLLFVRYPPPVVFFWALPVALVVLLPITSYADKPPGAWVALVVLGVVSTFGAYLAYGAGLVRLDATRASITATLEPVLAGLLAFALWRERFGPLGYAGGAMIIGAVLAMAVADTRRGTAG